MKGCWTVVQFLLSLCRLHSRSKGEFFVDKRGPLLAANKLRKKLWHIFCSLGTKIADSPESEKNSKFCGYWNAASPKIWKTVVAYNVTNFHTSSLVHQQIQNWHILNLLSQQEGLLCFPNSIKPIKIKITYLKKNLLVYFFIPGFWVFIMLSFFPYALSFIECPRTLVYGEINFIVVSTKDFCLTTYNF